MRSNIGVIIGGYCNGFFGRDDYEEKMIVFETYRSICCIYPKRDDFRGWLSVADFENEEEKNEYIDKWKKEADKNREAEDNY